MKTINNHFWTGVGSILELFPPPSEKIRVPNHKQSVGESLEKDWQKIGHDLWQSVNKYEQHVE